MIKKILFVFLLFATHIAMYAQNIFEKKDNISDFKSKTMMVVINNGNSISDLLFKEVVSQNWNISTFEFCTLEEFDKLKTNKDYFFLIRLDDAISKKIDPAIEFISLLRGNEKASHGVEEMQSILDLPLRPLDKDESMLTYLPAFINIIQKHVELLIENNIYAYAGMSVYAEKMNNQLDSKIYFSQDDFSYDITSEHISELFIGNAHIIGEEEKEKIFADADKNKIVSIVISPYENTPGSSCYKMLIKGGEELVYYTKHRVTKTRGIGFLKEEVKRLSAPYRVNSRKTIF